MAPKPNSTSVRFDPPTRELIERISRESGQTFATIIRRGVEAIGSNWDRERAILRRAAEAQKPNHDTSSAA